MSFFLEFLQIEEDAPAESDPNEDQGSPPSDQVSSSSHPVPPPPPQPKPPTPQTEATTVTKARVPNPDKCRTQANLTSSSSDTSSDSDTSDSSDSDGTKAKKLRKKAKKKQRKKEKKRRKKEKKKRRKEEGRKTKCPEGTQDASQSPSLPLSVHPLASQNRPIPKYLPESNSSLSGTSFSSQSPLKPTPNNCGLKSRPNSRTSRTRKSLFKTLNEEALSQNVSQNFFPLSYDDNDENAENLSPNLPTFSTQPPLNLVKPVPSRPHHDLATTSADVGPIKRAGVTRSKSVGSKESKRPQQPKKKKEKLLVSFSFLNYSYSLFVFNSLLLFSKNFSDFKQSQLLASEADSIQEV